MESLYVGEEDRIDLENGDQVFILKDLSQGADDDLSYFDIEKGGDGTRMDSTKVLELAIVRIIRKDGTEEHPTYDDVRQMKSPHSAKIRDEVMNRWFPLGWAILKEMTDDDDQVARSASGKQSIFSKVIARIRRFGLKESTSLERCGGHWQSIGGPLGGLFTILGRLLSRKGAQG